MGQVEVDHNHIGLESLRCFHHVAAVCDMSDNVAVQCQQPADGFGHSSMIFGYEHAGSLGHTSTVRHTVPDGPDKI